MHMLHAERHSILKRNALQKMQHATNVIRRVITAVCVYPPQNHWQICLFSFSKCHSSVGLLPSALCVILPYQKLAQNPIAAAENLPVCHKLNLLSDFQIASTS